MSNHRQHLLNQVVSVVVNFSSQFVYLLNQIHPILDFIVPEVKFGNHVCESPTTPLAHLTILAPQVIPQQHTSCFLNDTQVHTSNVVYQQIELHSNLPFLPMLQSL